MARRLLILLLMISPLVSMAQGRTNYIIGRVISEADSSSLKDVKVFGKVMIE